MLPVVGGEEGHLVGGPAAFGADGERGVAGLLIEGGEEWGLLLGFAEEDAGGSGLAFEGELKGGRGGDLWDVGAAGLLGGFEGDAAPALDALLGGLGEVLLGAAGENGGDAGDAEFGRLFDGPLEVIELEDGEKEMDWEGGVGLELFVKSEDDLRLGGAGDLGAVEEAIGDDVIDLAGLGAEDAGEVGGLIAGEGGGGGGPGIGDEAASHCQLSGFGDRYGNGGLVVEGQGEGGIGALVPGRLGDGELEEEGAYGGLAGWDGGVA